MPSELGMAAVFFYTTGMDRVIFTPSNTDADSPREEERQPFIFPGQDEPVYGPRRWPEGPATFRRGAVREPPMEGRGGTPIAPIPDELPSPETALFAPQSEPGLPGDAPRSLMAQLFDFLGVTSSDPRRVLDELGAGAGTALQRSEELGEQVGSSVMSRYFLGEWPEDWQESTWNDFFMEQYKRNAPPGTTSEELQPYVDRAVNSARILQYEPLDLALGDAVDAGRIVARGAAVLGGALGAIPVAERTVQQILQDDVMGLIAPGNLMNFMKQYKNVEFVPARVLAKAPGNPLRRTPEQMAELRAEIMANPEGIDDPIKIMFDQETGNWHIGEGNHRVALAAEANLPLPVVVLGSRRAPAYATMQPASPAAMQNLETFSAAHHNYVPSNLAASEIGLPVVPLEEVASYIDNRALAGEVPAESAQEFRDFIATYQPRYLVEGTTPTVVEGTAEWQAVPSAAAVATQAVDPLARENFFTDLDKLIKSVSQPRKKEIIQGPTNTAEGFELIRNEQADLARYLTRNQEDLLLIQQNHPHMIHSALKAVAPNIIRTEEDSAKIIAGLTALPKPITRNVLTPRLAQSTGTFESDLFLNSDERSVLKDVVNRIEKAAGLIYGNNFDSDLRSFDPELMGKLREYYQLKAMPYVTGDPDLPFADAKGVIQRMDELENEIFTILDTDYSRQLDPIHGLTDSQLNEIESLLFENHLTHHTSPDARRLTADTIYANYGNDGAAIERAITAYTGWVNGKPGAPLVGSASLGNLFSSGAFSQELVNEVEAIRPSTEPQTFGYAILNTWLRDPNGFTLTNNDAELLNAWTSSLDELFNGPLGRTTEDTFIYRGMLNRPNQLPLNDPDALIGTVVSDAAYSSFANMPFPALRFMREKAYAPMPSDATRVLWRVELPRDSQALHISEVSTIAAEQEVLLPRNANLEITDVTQEDGFTLIDAVYLGTGD